MRANLQPKVAWCQQLIVGRASHTVQRMVGSNRTEAKEAFSRAFKKALDRINFEPDPGRIRALSKRLEVTYEAARKWLSGESVPDQTNMLRIQRELKIDASELRIDFDPESREFGHDLLSRKLAAMWPDLSDEVRGQIIGFALVQATTRPAVPKKDDSQEGQTGT